MRWGKQRFAESGMEWDIRYLHMDKQWYTYIILYNFYNNV